MCGVVRGPDKLPQQLQRQRGLAFPRILHHDLHQDHVGQVLSRARVQHLHVDPVPHHRRDVLQLHVAAGARIVQTAVAVLFDDYIGFAHGTPDKDNQFRITLTLLSGPRILNSDTASQYNTKKE